VTRACLTRSASPRPAGLGSGLAGTGRVTSSAEPTRSRARGGRRAAMGRRGSPRRRRSRKRHQSSATRPRRAPESRGLRALHWRYRWCLPMPRRGSGSRGSGPRPSPADGEPVGTPDAVRDGSSSCAGRSRPPEWMPGALDLRTTETAPIVDPKINPDLDYHPKARQPNPQTRVRLSTMS
jgi:hypothetical protein